MGTIHIGGSHGSLLVHYPSGHILHADACDCADCQRLGGYDSYRWFDPAGFEPAAIEHGSTDILYCSFVCDRGIYTSAMRSAEVVDRHGSWMFAQEVPLLTDQRS